MQTHVDIAIAGGGPVGLAIARMLIARGMSAQRIALIDAKSLATAAEDPRSVALSYGSRQLLEPIHGWPLSSTAIREIHISRRGSLGRTLIESNEYQLPAHTMGFGIKGCINWRSDFVRNYRDYKASNFKASELSWLWSINRGIMTPPGQDDQWLISLAHGQREIDILVEDFRELAQALRA